MKVHAPSISLAVLCLTHLAPSAPASAQAQPELRGPHMIATWDAGAVNAGGALIPTTVYSAMDADVPLPVVAVVHGASRTGAYMAEMAQTLASYGFVAVVPTMPCGLLGCDHDANAIQVTALLDWAVAQSAMAGTPIAGRVDGERRGVIGHSWGGLAVLLTSARDAQIDSAVYLDPNDDVGGPAVAAAPNIGMPVALLRAQVPGACNSLWQPDTFNQFTGPKLQLVVTGSGHCDVEEPTDVLCAFACSAGSATTTPIFRRYAVAFTRCALVGDAETAAWVGGASLNADESAGTVNGVGASGLEALPCNAMGRADAGAPRDDAAGPNPPVDAGEARGDGAATPTSDGSAPPLSDASVEVAADAVGGAAMDSGGAEPATDAANPGGADAAASARDARNAVDPDGGPAFSVSDSKGCQQIPGRPPLSGAGTTLLAAVLGLALRRRRQP